MADIMQEDLIYGGMVMRHLRQREKHYLSITAIEARGADADGNPDAVMRFLSDDGDKAVSMYTDFVWHVNATIRKHRAASK